MAELEKLKTRLQEAKTENLTSVFAALEAKDKELSELQEVQAKTLAALKAGQQTEPRPGTVPMAEHAKLQAQVSQLTNQIAHDKKQALLKEGLADGRLKEGLADGRILPGHIDYWEPQTLESLTAWMEMAQPIAALTGMQSKGKAPRTTTAVLSSEEAYVAEALGLSPEEYTKHKEAN